MTGVGETDGPDDPSDGDAGAAGESTSAADSGAAGGTASDGDRDRRERSFRGISRRLAVRYLSNLGGDPVGDGAARVTGDGWEATLSEDTARVGPSLTLTEVTVTFEGDPEALDDLIPAFAQKAMRAGG